MVKASGPTDAAIGELVPHLEEGDIVIDGGNAQFTDARRREAKLRDLGLHFVGAGISGGEVGALTGPSIMPLCPVRRGPLRWVGPSISHRVWADTG